MLDFLFQIIQQVNFPLLIITYLFLSLSLIYYRRQHYHYIRLRFARQTARVKVKKMKEAKKYPLFYLTPDEYLVCYRALEENGAEFSIDLGEIAQAMEER